MTQSYSSNWFTPFSIQILSLLPFFILFFPSNLNGQNEFNFIEGKLYVEVLPRYQNMNWEYDEAIDKPRFHGLKKWIHQFHISKIEKIEDGESKNAYYFHFSKTHLTTAFFKTLQELPYIQKVKQIQIPIAIAENVPEIVVPSPSNKILLPTAFSPNNDGKNDYFTIVGQNIESYELQIFNRLGEAVFQMNESSAFAYGWDGKVNGRSLPAGVYAYYGWVRFLDGEERGVRGYLTLVGE